MIAAIELKFSCFICCCFLLFKKPQKATSVSAPLRNGRSISFQRWRSPRARRRTRRTMTTTTTKKKKEARPTTSSRPPAPQTRTRQLKASTAAASTLGKEALSGSRRALLKKPRPREEFGAAGAPPPQAAGGRCSPRGPGRQCRGPSPPAARAARPAAACPLAWSCPHPSAATPPGQRRPCMANTSRRPLRGARPQSDPCPRCGPLAATARLAPEHLHHHSGYSTGPPGACHGRAQVRGTVPSSR